MHEQVGWNWDYLLEDLSKQNVIAQLQNQKNGTSDIISRYTEFLACHGYAAGTRRV